jgi:YD repeat-containing protein
MSSDSANYRRRTANRSPILKAVSRPSRTRTATSITATRDQYRPAGLKPTNAATTTYIYDASGNLTKITSPMGFETTMSYDSSGRLASRRDQGQCPRPPVATHQSGATDGDRDSDGRTRNVTSFTYHENGLHTTTRDRDETACVITLVYDDANRLCRQQIRARASRPASLAMGKSPGGISRGQNLTYDYDESVDPPKP